MSHEIVADSPTESQEIDRIDTLMRLALTVIIFLISRIVETVIGVLALFSVGYTLVTQRKPPIEVRRFANHALSYAVTIVRYLTYNSDETPFPFGEFPPELDLETPVTPG